MFIPNYKHIIFLAKCMPLDIAEYNNKNYFPKMDFDCTSCIEISISYCLLAVVLSLEAKNILNIALMLLLNLFPYLFFQLLAIQIVVT